MRVIKLLLICLICIPYNLIAQPGVLDPSFGQGGIAVTTENTTQYQRILPLSNGKFLVTSSAFNEVTYGNGAKESVTYSEFRRINADGSRDLTYGANGMRDFISSDVDHNYFTGFGRLSDGSIVAIETYGYSGSNNPLNTVWKFNADGTGGTIIAELTVAGFGSPHLNGITVDDANRIVVTGWVKRTGAGNQTYIARLLSDGSMDESFNNVGYRIIVENLSFNYSGEEVTTDRNNNIIVVEDGYYSAGLGYVNGHYMFKYLEDGSARTFTNKKLDGQIKSLVTDNNSKIIAFAGVTIKRYNTDGTLDKIVSTTGHSSRRVIVQPDGKIVSIAPLSMNGHNVFNVIRYGTDGNLDPTFGSTGSVTTDLNFESLPQDVIYRNRRLYVSGQIVVTIDDRGDPFGTIVAYDATDVLLQCTGNKNVYVNAGQCYATLGSIQPILIPAPVRPDRESGLPFDPYAGITYRKVHNGNVETGSGSVNGTVFNIGTTNVTYTYTDVTTQTCSFDVTVTDQDPPVARCKNITIQLNALGTAIISAAAIDNGSTDGCGIQSMSLSKTNFDCSNVGANTVTLTVTDNNNNQSTCTAIVTVEAVTKASPVHFAVTFSEPITGFTAAAISFEGSTAPGLLAATVSGGPTIYDVAVSGMTGSGIIKISTSAGTVTGESLVANPATVCPSSKMFMVDQNGPTVTINQAAGQPELTSSSPIHFTVSFGLPVVDFDGSEISFIGSTVGGILSATVTPNGLLSYDVAVSGMTTTGTVVASILPGVIQSTFFGFYNQGSTSTDNSVTYDPSLRPTVTINQATSQSDPTPASPINFTVRFSDPVTGFTGYGISFAGSTAPGTLMATVTGGPLVYNVAVRGMTGPGNVVVNVPPGVAFTTSGAANLASASTDNTVAFTVPSSALSVTINQSSQQVDPTPLSPVRFTVSFSETVLDFDASDISFAGSTVGGTLVAQVQSSILSDFRIHEVTVTGMAGTGTVVASILPGVARGLFGITNGLSTSTDNSVLYDPFIPPTVTVNKAITQPDPTPLSPLRFTVTFSQPVGSPAIGLPGNQDGANAFTASDISFAGSTAPGTLMATVTGSPLVYDVAVRGYDRPGNGCGKCSPGVAANMSGVNNLASTSTDNSVDFTVPSTTLNVTINQSSQQVDPTPLSPIRFTVSFSEGVFDFDASDISFAGSTVGGTLVAQVQSSILSDFRTHEVTVTGMAGTGTVVASVLPGVARGLFGITNGLSTTTDNSVLYDPFIPPTVTVNKAITQPDPTPLSPLHFTVTFSQPVGSPAIGLPANQGGANAFTASDISFAGSTAPGTLIATVTGGPLVYDVAVRGMTGPGTVMVSIPPGVAANMAGVNNLASTSTDNSVDFTVPSTTVNVTINQSSQQVDPTPLSPVRFTVSFSEGVLDFDASDISFAGSTVGGTLVAQVQSSILSDFRTHEVTVTGMTDPGTVVASILPGVARTFLGSVTNGLSTSTDNSVLYVSPPTVTIHQAETQTDPTFLSPIHYTVTFNQGVTGFTSSDVLFTGSTAPGTLTATVTGGPAVYDVAVSGMTSSGNVVIAVPANAAVNTFAIGSLASNNLDNTVSYVLPLMVTMNQTEAQADPTITTPVHFTATFSKPVTGFTGSDISFSGSTAAGTLAANITGGPEVFDVAVSGMTGSGLVVASIPSGAAVNASSVSNQASISTDNTVMFNYCVALNITAAPSSAQAAQCSNTAVNFSVTATGTDLHYQWKVDGINAGTDANSLSYNPSSLSAGLHTITVEVTNNCSSESAGTTLTINADVTAPVISGCPPNQTISLAANACMGTATWTEPAATDNCSTGNLSYFSRSHAPGSVFALGTTTVTYVFQDPNGNQSTCTFTITMQDLTPPLISNISVNKPVLIAANHKMVDITVNYDLIDGCPSSATLSVSSNEPESGTSNADRSPDWIIIDDHHLQLRAERAPKGNGRIYTITITATDRSGNVSATTKTVVVAHNIPAPISGTAVKIGSTVNLAGTFWDVPGNKHTAKWVIDDNTTTNGTVTEPSGLKNGTVSGSYKFTAAGVYKLQMNITDQKGVTTYTNTNDELEAIVVVYDPNGGYTYGGGSFNSPAGALKKDLSATGDVSYGFTVNYYKSATMPKGETQFDFKLGDFEFNALNFDYLSINKATAQFRGTGKIIGGQSGIAFIMTVTDGQLDGSGTDKIRVKIFNKNTGQVYYDNQPGASDAANPATVVGENSTIVISSNAANTRLITNANDEVKSESQQLQIENVKVIAKGLQADVFPNPATTNFTLKVRSSNSKDLIHLQVLNMLGTVIESRNLKPGQTVTFGSMYRPGSYYIRVVQGKEQKQMKLIKLSD